MFPRLSLRARPLRQILILISALVILLVLYQSGSVVNATRSASLQANATAELTGEHRDHVDDFGPPQTKPNAPAVLTNDQHEQDKDAEHPAAKENTNNDAEPPAGKDNTNNDVEHPAVKDNANNDVEHQIVNDNTTPALTKPNPESDNDVEHSEAKQPEAKQPEAKQPEAKQPEAKQPEAKQPEDKKPEDKKSEDKHSDSMTKPPKSPQTERPIVDTPLPFVYQYNHTEIFSSSSKDGKYRKIDFSGSGANDPSMIPHPNLKDTWVIVAQSIDKREEEEGPYEYVCNAMFNDEGVLHCTTPVILPAGSPVSTDKCPNDSGRIKVSGARSPRIFYGPRTPYFTYEIHAEVTCLGQNPIKHNSQYIQDLRTLLYLGTKPSATDVFAKSTKLDIPPAAMNTPFKNWFLFWDADNQTYAHYDIVPKRIYSKIDPTGSIGEDLSAKLPASDAKCLHEFTPPFSRDESFTQATNSLSITTCKRFDENCKVTASNTFIMAIFQHRRERRDMDMLEPYVILFDRTAPFATHGITKRPLWFSGRKGKTDANEVKDPNQVETLNTMSISWKDTTQTYHGYADDILHVSFGVQGRMTAVIDVVAGDLLEDLGLCSSLEQTEV